MRSFLPLLLACSSLYATDYEVTFYSGCEGLERIQAQIVLGTPQEPAGSIEFYLWEDLPSRSATPHVAQLPITRLQPILESLRSGAPLRVQWDPISEQTKVIASSNSGSAPA